MSRNAFSIAAATAALGLTLLTSTVLAAPATYDARTVEVEYGDVDLSSAEGAAALYRRIAAAAREACATERAHDARALLQELECTEQAVARAVTRIDRPELTALHRERAAGSRRA